MDKTTFALFYKQKLKNLIKENLPISICVQSISNPEM